MELAQAISYAQAGQEVWAAAGTYRPDCDSIFQSHNGDRNASFNMRSNVAINRGTLG